MARRTGFIVALLVLVGCGAALAAATSGDEPPSYCPADNNLVVGTKGNDVLTGTEGPDSMVGLAGDDKLSSLEGDDCVVGGSGDDLLIADTGNDLLVGGVGNDSLQAGPLVADGVEDDDIAFGGQGIDYVNGNAANDRLFGGSGPDYLKGYIGDDRLQGGLGVDLIDGNQDDDVLIAADDESDVASCGGGSNRAWLDSIDVFTQCQTRHTLRPAQARQFARTHNQEAPSGE